MKELKHSQRLIITSTVIIQDKHGLTKAVSWAGLCAEYADDMTLWLCSQLWDCDINFTSWTAKKSSFMNSCFQLIELVDSMNRINSKTLLQSIILLHNSTKIEKASIC